MQERIVTIVPLWRFHLDGDGPFRLNRQISIRKLTRKEKKETEFHVGFMLALAPRFCIQCVCRKSSAPDWDNGEIQAAKVIEAMRLFATGDVGAFVSVSVFSPALTSIGVMSRVGLTPKLVTDVEGQAYRMAADEREKFIKFWTEYLAWKPKTALARHVNRFIKAYTNTDRQDRLVDFVTSMEGLVLPNERQEMRKQFAFRIAWVLGTTTIEREAIFKKALRIYDERSAVVHGGAGAASGKNLNICQSAEEMNRQLLVYAMRTPDQFIAENLNKIVLGV